MKKWVIIGICLAFASAFSLREFLFANESNQNEVAMENLAVDSSLVQELYTLINPSNDPAIIADMYLNGFPSNEHILATGAMNYIRNNYDVNSTEVKKGMLVVNFPAAYLRDSIKEVFGNIDYQDESFYVYNNEYGICGFTYLPEVDAYESLNGCGGSQFESFKRQIVDAKKEGQQVKIFEKSIYIYNDWDDYVSRRYVYSDYSQEKMLDYIETSSSENTDITLQQYIDKASTFVYIFEYDGANYIFKELKKIEG